MWPIERGSNLQIGDFISLTGLPWMWSYQENAKSIIFVPAQIWSDFLLANLLTSGLMCVLCNMEKEVFLPRINKLQMPLNPRINTWTVSSPRHQCFPFSRASVKPNKQNPLSKKTVYWISLERHLTASETNYRRKCCKLQKKDFVTAWAWRLWQFQHC